MMENPDSAFISGTLLLPGQAEPLHGIREDNSWDVGPLGDILLAISVIACIMAMKRILRVVPSIMGCCIRWKENLNIEDSMRLRLDRNVLAGLLVVPFCLLAARYRLYAPDFTAGNGDLPMLAITACALFLYLLLRIIVQYSIKPKGISQKIYAASFCTAFTFFSVAAAVMIVTAGICSFAGTAQILTRDILLYEAAAVYALFIIRKTQIFTKSCSLFKAISYLCALEILPAGILVASAIFL